MSRFAEVLNQLGLRDLPLQGFTWRGGFNSSSISRVYRFLVTSKAIDCTLPRPLADHCLILLDIEWIRSGPCPSRFEIIWLKFEGFKDLLRDWWQSLQFSGSFSFVLASKLKAMKGILKVWNKEILVGLRPKRRESYNQECDLEGEIGQQQKKIL